MIPGHGSAGARTSARPIVPDLVSAVRRAAQRWPDRVAWVFDPGETVTFADIDRRTRELAAGLSAAGVRRGDRVGVMAGNTAWQPLTWLALGRLGGVCVALNPRYGSADLGHVVRSAGCRLLVGSEALLDRLRPPPDAGEWPPAVTPQRLVAAACRGREPADVTVVPSDVLNVQFTSGTSGRPKGCLLTHEYWTVLSTSLVAEFPRLAGTDVMLTAQSFHYIDPMWNVAAALLAGARLVILDGFHPATFWGSVRRHQVTYFYCLAAMPALLLTQPPRDDDRDHRVRLVQCSAIPPARHAELESRWGTPWFEAFGMTETGADLRVTDTDHDELVGSGCVGGPASHREVRVVDVDGRAVAAGDVGELTLRGPGLMAGYLDDPAATAEVTRGGWFHTGDLARQDAAGRVYLVGRSKDMIRRAGENIAAREVEDVLLGHPRVTLAAVVGVPDELRGEEVKAVLVTNGQADLDELVAWCQRALAPFKVPRYWEFRDALPMTPSHRVAKAGLQQAQTTVVDRLEPGR